MDFVVARTFSSLYIALDIAWLLIYAGILLYFKKQTAIAVDLTMGVVYFLVDYGIFYKLLHTRQIEGTDPFWFLLWLSMSYGFTSFAWITLGQLSQDMARVLPRSLLRAVPVPIML